MGGVSTMEIGKSVCLGDGADEHGRRFMSGDSGPAGKPHSALCSASKAAEHRQNLRVQRWALHCILSSASAA